MATEQLIFKSIHVLCSCLSCYWVGKFTISCVESTHEVKCQLYLFIKPAAFDYWSVWVSLDGVGPLAKIVDFFR